ncbi:hypothetical protein [Amycolatopsis sp.]|uniref:hypothetical protein n=1 Tax=Amycolatopsis sp. TaxID=37632 RepID=UPI002CE68AE7|nr:hypothetical protein [Amycolatopsis sp.]HVV08929.1 hypothetical protein [Amycolatopsis sp.]
MLRALFTAIAVVLIAGASAFLAIQPIAVVHPSTPVAAPAARPSARPTQPTTTTAPPTTTTTAPPATTTTAVAADPASVVENFYIAINNRDFATAWALGGQNLGHSYSDFVAGFANTVSDDLTVTSVSGQTVYVSLTAWETDGTAHYYTGSYTVADGQIRHGKLTG